MQKQLRERLREWFEIAATVAIMLFIPLIVFAVDLICWYALFGEVSEIAPTGNRMYNAFFFVLSAAIGSSTSHALMIVFAIGALGALVLAFWESLYPIMLASAGLVGAALLHLVSGWSAFTCLAITAPISLIVFLYGAWRALEITASEILHP